MAVEEDSNNMSTENTTLIRLYENISIILIKV